MRRRILTFPAVVLVLATACAVSIPPYPDSPLPSGPYPLEYEQMIRSWLFSRLRDPYSVRDLVIAEPVAGPLLRFDGGRGQYVGAYRGCVQYNAKNAFGAYVGLQVDSVWIRDDQIISIESGCRPLGPPPRSGPCSGPATIVSLFRCAFGISE
jgi:hypothetical protein